MTTYYIKDYIPGFATDDTVRFDCDVYFDDAVIFENTEFTGNTTIGDASTDTLTVAAAATFSTDVTFNVGSGEAITLTVSDVSAPFVMTNTVTTAGTTGGRLLSHVKTNVAMGAWANGLKGYWQATGTSGRVTGLASGVCGEIKTANTNLASGAYYALEAEYVAGGTSTTSTGSGTRVGWIYMNNTGDADGDFDANGYLFTAAGLTAGAGKLLSANSKTLRVQTGLAGSETTEYLVMSDNENTLTFGATGTPLSYTAGTPFWALYATNSGTSGSTNAEPFLVETTLTGAGQVGGRGKFKLTCNAAQGGWTNALKAEVSYGTNGSTTGLGSCMCTDLNLNTGTTNGTYACYEANVIVPSSGSLGTATTIFALNASGTDADTFDSSGYLIHFGAELDAASGKFIDTDKTGEAAYGGIRVYITGVGTKYIRLFDAA